MNALTKIILHGELGEKIGTEWNLAIESVGEAIRAIQVLSRDKLFPYLIENDKRGVGYKVVINGDVFEPEQKLDMSHPETILESELVIKRKIETIDIVPVIQGAEDFIGIIGGIILIALAFVFPQFAGFLVLAGLGLIAAGVMNLLSKPPKFEDFREIKGGGKVSYLFNGPQNTVKEGGPVPVGYGRLIVGSQVITATYEIAYREASLGALTI